jgi:hypothetical protein
MTEGQMKEPLEKAACGKGTGCWCRASKPGFIKPIATNFLATKNLVVDQIKKSGVEWKASLIGASIGRVGWV